MNLFELCQATVVRSRHSNTPTPSLFSFVRTPASTSRGHPVSLSTFLGARSTSGESSCSSRLSPNAPTMLTIL